jgi:hypothetical protein
MTRRHNAIGGAHPGFVGVAQIVPQQVDERPIPGRLLTDADGPQRLTFVPRTSLILVGCSAPL